MPRPFTTFNFLVVLVFPDEPGAVCNAEFSDCDGLEMNHEIKTLREGGNNRSQIHLAGPVSYGQLTLKRGMTRNFGLWRWFDRVHGDRSLRASGEVLMLSSDRESFDARFRLLGCLPLKIKAPSLTAKDGAVAIEEMQIAYESLCLVDAYAPESQQGEVADA